VIEDDVQRALACANTHSNAHPNSHPPTHTQVTVIRNGADKVISCHDVVVGDIMKLSTGDIITADAYAIGANDLQISEKALTGETGTLSPFVSLCMVALYSTCARALTFESLCQTS
jgi:P-type E1-E2 ATPase